MTASLIIDCSLTMTWCFADEATDASADIQDRLTHEGVLVPAHWFLEVTNVLVMAEKRRRITSSRSDAFVQLLQVLDIEVDNDIPGRAFDHVLPLCRTHKLTSYDAAYLDLAVRRRLPLASLDKDLRAAAEELGIELLGQ
ncbi:MAG TPA: type II toxin-antitoxin system VapC family toxin [Planctomycetaceae bacterium]